MTTSTSLFAQILPIFTDQTERAATEALRYILVQSQAARDALEQMLERADQALDQVIEFTISEDELVRRITGRYVCTKCDAVYNEHSKPTQRKNICDVCGGTAFRRREDDRAETVAERMAAYRAETAPLVPYYGSRGLLTQIDGSQSTVKVTDALLGALS